MNVLCYFNEALFANEIPYKIKEKYKKIIIDDGLYEWPRELFENYISIPAYKNDFTKFIIELVERNDIKPETKGFLYKELIWRSEKTSYIKKLLTLPISKDLKITYLSKALYLLHFSIKSDGFECKDTLSDTKNINTDSLLTYNDQYHTPDFIFDCDKHTTWRITNINDKEETRLNISSYMLDCLDYKIKILSGNYESENSFNYYCRPKKIKITLTNKKTNKIVNEKEFSLKDIREFQEIYFKMGIVQSIKNKLFSRESGTYEMKIDILDYYKGTKPHCDIAELRVIPIE